MAESSTPVERRPLYRGARLGVVLLVLSLCTVVLGSRAAGVTGVSAQSGQLHVLTSADNGSTLTIPVGDAVELQLNPNYTWSDVSVSDTSVLHRPPVALMVDEQGLWDAQMPGAASITATGTAICAAGVPCPQYAILFSATVDVVAAGNQPPAAPQINYPAGWNLVGVPQNTTLSTDAYAWDAGTGAYQVVSAGSNLKGGSGYWVYFTSATSVPLAQGTASAQVSAPANAWVLVGNPSGVASATVSGASAVYSWNPATMQYVAATTLMPGAGAWAISAAGGTITVTAQGQ